MIDVRCLAAVAAMATLSTTAMADEPKKCHLLSANSTKTNYEEIGTDACIALCKATDGCIAWTYQPHNFNPKKAPGECRRCPMSGEKRPQPRNSAAGSDRPGC